MNIMQVLTSFRQCSCPHFFKDCMHWAGNVTFSRSITSACFIDNTCSRALQKDWTFKLFELLESVSGFLTPFQTDDLCEIVWFDFLSSSFFLITGRFAKMRCDVAGVFGFIRFSSFAAVTSSFVSTVDVAVFFLPIFASFSTFAIIIFFIPANVKYNRFLWLNGCTF